jgi:hypothetical protein
MRRNKTVLMFTCISVVALVLSACQKEVSMESFSGTPSGETGSGGNGSELGNWKAIKMVVDGTSTVTINQSGSVLKAVTYSKYTTKNNTGLISFNGSQLTMKNEGYDLDYVAKTESYLDGVLFDNSSTPVQFSVQAPDATVAYQKISADSLYFPAGDIFSPSTGQSIPGGASAFGVRLIFKGDTLIMHGQTESNTSVNIQGMQGEMHDKSAFDYYLLKQR